MKNKKIIVPWLATLLFFLITTTSVYAVNVHVNNEDVSFNDSTGYPFIDSNGRTLVPLTATMEAGGATVSWNGSTKTASVSKNGITVLVPIGQSHIIVDGKTVQNDAAAVIHNNRTYLPIRAVLESLGFNVDWNSTTKTVVASDYVVQTEWVPYSTSDYNLLLTNISKGYVVYRDGQYWASPEYSTMMSNTKTVYSHDISEGKQPVSRPTTEQLSAAVSRYEWYNYTNLKAAGITADLSGLSFEQDKSPSAPFSQWQASGKVILKNNTTSHTINISDFTFTPGVKAEATFDGIKVKAVYNSGSDGIVSASSMSLEFYGQDLSDLKLLGI